MAKRHDRSISSLTVSFCPATFPILLSPLFLFLLLQAEYLGIGTFGNRRAAPNAEAEEFSSSLLKVIGNEKMKQRAVEVAEQCRKRGGARAASDKILELAA